MGCKAKPVKTPANNHRSSTKYKSRSSSQASSCPLSSIDSAQSTASNDSGNLVNSDKETCCYSNKALSRQEKIYLSKQLRSPRKNSISFSRVTSETDYDDSDQVIYNKKRYKSKSQDDKSKQKGHAGVEKKSPEETQVSKVIEKPKHDMKSDDNKGNLLKEESEAKTLDNVDKTVDPKLSEGDNNEEDDVCECEEDVLGYIYFNIEKSNLSNSLIFFNASL